MDYEPLGDNVPITLACIGDTDTTNDNFDILRTPTPAVRSKSNPLEFPIGTGTGNMDILRTPTPSVQLTSTLATNGVNVAKVSESMNDRTTNANVDNCSREVTGESEREGLHGAATVDVEDVDAVKTLSETVKDETKVQVANSVSNENMIAVESFCVNEELQNTIPRASVDRSTDASRGMASPTYQDLSTQPPTTILSPISKAGLASIGPDTDIAAVPSQSPTRASILASREFSVAVTPRTPTLLSTSVSTNLSSPSLSSTTIATQTPTPSHVLSPSSANNNESTTVSTYRAGTADVQTTHTHIHTSIPTPTEVQILSPVGILSTSPAQVPSPARISPSGPSPTPSYVRTQTSSPSSIFTSISSGTHTLPAEGTQQTPQPHMMDSSVVIATVATKNAKASTANVQENTVSSVMTLKSMSVAPMVALTPKPALPPTTPLVYHKPPILGTHVPITGAVFPPVAGLPLTMHKQPHVTTHTSPTTCLTNAPVPGVYNPGIVAPPAPQFVAQTIGTIPVPAPTPAPAPTPILTKGLAMPIVTSRPCSINTNTPPIPALTPSPTPTTALTPSLTSSTAFPSEKIMNSSIPADLQQPKQSTINEPMDKQVYVPIQSSTQRQTYSATNAQIPQSAEAELGAEQLDPNVSSSRPPQPTLRNVRVVAMYTGSVLVSGMIGETMYQGVLFGIPSDINEEGANKCTSTIMGGINAGKKRQKRISGHIKQNGTFIDNGHNYFVETSDSDISDLSECSEDAAGDYDYIKYMTKSRQPLVPLRATRTKITTEPPKSSKRKMSYAPVDIASSQDVNTLQKRSVFNSQSLARPQSGGFKAKSEKRLVVDSPSSLMCTQRDVERRYDTSGMGLRVGTVLSAGVGLSTQRNSPGTTQSLSHTSSYSDTRTQSRQQGGGAGIGRGVAKESSQQPPLKQHVATKRVTRQVNTVEAPVVGGRRSLRAIEKLQSQPQIHTYMNEFSDLSDSEVGNRPTTLKGTCAPAPCRTSNSENQNVGMRKSLSGPNSSALGTRVSNSRPPGTHHRLARSDSTLSHGSISTPPSSISVDDRGRSEFDNPSTSVQRAKEKRNTNSNASKAVPKPKNVCVNCHTDSTPYWRPSAKQNDKLCNACGLYYGKYRVMRPASMFEDRGKGKIKPGKKRSARGASVSANGGGEWERERGRSRGRPRGRARGRGRPPLNKAGREKSISNMGVMWNNLGRKNSTGSVDSYRSGYVASPLPHNPLNLPMDNSLGIPVDSTIALPLSGVGMGVGMGMGVGLDMNMLNYPFNSQTSQPQQIQQQQMQWRAMHQEQQHNQNLTQLKKEVDKDTDGDPSSPSSPRVNSSNNVSSKRKSTQMAKSNSITSVNEVYPPSQSSSSAASLPNPLPKKLKLKLTVNEPK
eukprot:CFRG0551T1